MAKDREVEEPPDLDDEDEELLDDIWDQVGKEEEDAGGTEV
jgi:hypothetical protein